MKRLILHIGNYKTGSTAIQTFLHLNRDMFAAHGILVPRAGADQGAHHKWAHLFQGRLDVDQEKELIGQIKAEISHSECNIVLVSSEVLFNGRSVAVIKSLFPDMEFSIVCYLRRQDEFLSAFYHQLVKHPNFMESKPASIECMIKRDAARYYAALQRWEGLADRQRIFVYPFELARLGGNLIEHFLDVLGLTFSDDWKPVPKINETIHTELLEFLRIANGLGLSKTDHQCLLDALIDLSGKAGSSEAFSKRNVFSPRQRLEILNALQDENDRIEKNYSTLRDGVFFQAPLPSVEDEWEPVFLSVEDLARIMAGLWTTQQSTLAGLADLVQGDLVQALLKERHDLYQIRHNLIEENIKINEQIGQYKKKYS